MNSFVDPRRADKINRFKPAGQQGGSEDLVPDYMNILGNFILKDCLHIRRFTGDGIICHNLFTKIYLIDCGILLQIYSFSHTPIILILKIFLLCCDINLC